MCNVCLVIASYHYLKNDPLGEHPSEVKNCTFVKYYSFVNLFYDKIFSYLWIFIWENEQIPSFSRSDESHDVAENFESKINKNKKSEAAVTCGEI